MKYFKSGLDRIRLRLQFMVTKPDMFQDKNESQL